ncbi:WSSV324 [White spot syndrome virus]|uniref:WSSV324 n=1 Tax=White spot syndrome virus TaxID=342409 RepID=A0A2I6SC28_9VIRU|nr:WSSV324 [White spot syndrome virus]
MAARAGAGTGACMLGCASAETDASGLPRLAYIQVVPLTPTSRNLPSNASSPTEWGPDLATGSLLAIPCLGSKSTPALNGEDLRVL